MAKDATKSNDAEGMSDESIGYLADAKRGKARKFVLITKGMNVVSLVVYKKGSLEGYKKQAKESGRGTLVHGVVTGKGENIRFLLSQADGFDREPVKPLALKSYLQEAADFACKPAIEIVASHTVMLDPDDPLAARFLALKPEALKGAAAHAEQANAIQSALTEIENILDQDPASDVAYGKISALERLVKSLGAGSNQPPPAPIEGVPPPPPPPPPMGESESAKFLQRLTTVIKQAAPFAATIGAALKPLAESARAAAGQGDFATANKKLLEIAQLIKNAASGAAADDTSSASSSLTAAQITDRLKSLLTRAKQVTDSALLGQVKQKAGEVQTLLRGPKLEDADRVLDELEALFEQSGTPVPPPAKVFELWRDKREEVMKRISKLQDALRNKPDKRFHEIAESGFNGVTKRLQVGLHVALLEYEQSNAESREITRLGAIKAADDLAKFLEKDPMVELIDENPFGVTVNLKQDLTDALTAITAALSS